MYQTNLYLQSPYLLEQRVEEHLPAEQHALVEHAVVEHALVEHALVEHAPVAVLVPERDKVKGLSVEDFMQGAVMDLDDWTCSTFRGL